MSVICSFIYFLPEWKMIGKENKEVNNAKQLIEFFRNYTKLADLADMAYLCFSLSYIFLYLS